MPDYQIHKAKLEEKLEQIVGELGQIAAYNETTDDWEAIPEVENGGGEADENSHADAAESLSERMATVTNLEQDYRNIKRALEKLTNGTYGICEISGEAIESERLLFKPDARTCHKHMDEESSLPI